MIIYGSQKNTPRQLPATLCEVALCDMCIPEFSIIGLYGAGPTHLPTSCTIYETETKDDGSTENDEENHTFNIVSNSDGTIASEALDKDTPMQYQYSTTRALTEEEAAHVIAGLKKILKIER